MTNEELRELIAEVDIAETIGLKPADIKWMMRARELAQTILRYREGY